MFVRDRPDFSSSKNTTFCLLIRLSQTTQNRITFVFVRPDLKDKNRTTATKLHRAVVGVRNQHFVSYKQGQKADESGQVGLGFGLFKSEIYKTRVSVACEAYIIILVVYHLPRNFPHKVLELPLGLPTLSGVRKDKAM